MNPGYGQQSRIPNGLSTALQATELAQITKNINWKVRFIKKHSLPVRMCVFGEHPNCISAHLLQVASVKTGK